MRVRSDAEHTALERMAHVRTNVHLAIGTMLSLFGLVYGETDPQDGIFTSPPIFDFGGYSAAPKLLLTSVGGSSI